MFTITWLCGLGLPEKCEFLEKALAWTSNALTPSKTLKTNAISALPLSCPDRSPTLLHLPPGEAASRREKGFPAREIPGQEERVLAERVSPRAQYSLAPAFPQQGHRQELGSSVTRSDRLSIGSAVKSQSKLQSDSAWDPGQ